MLLNLYFLAIAIVSIRGIPIAQDSVEDSAPKLKEEILRLLREVNSKRNNIHFDGFMEKKTTNEQVANQQQPTDGNLSYMKNTLIKLLARVNRMEVARGEPPLVRHPSLGNMTVSAIVFNNSKKKKRNQQDKWGKWTDWSACSVTCGKGRRIRWRHCQLKCDAETEMEEVSCQLPACSPAKLFGVIPV